jgi:chromosome segregation ATPase
VFWKRRTPGPPTDNAPAEIGPWILEGRRLFSLWEERVEQLDQLKSRLAAMAQEIEQLRAEVGHIDAMRAQIVRLVEESERRRMERDHLREVLDRIANLAQEAAMPTSADPPPAG